MRNLIIILSGIFLVGCQTTSNSSYTKLQNYLSEPSEMKLVVFAKSMWGAPDIFLSAVETENLYNSAHELLRECNSLNVPKSYYTCKVTHIGNKRIAYKNDTQLQRLFHIQELKNNPEYKSKNTAEKINTDLLTSQNIETTGIRIDGPYTAKNPYAKIADYKKIKNSQFKFKALSLSHLQEQNRRLTVVSGYSNSSAFEMIETIQSHCNSSKSINACKISYLGDTLINYQSERELVRLIEQYVENQNADLNNETPLPKRNLLSTTNDTSDIAIMGPYNSIELLKARKAFYSNNEIAKFQISVATNTNALSLTQEKYLFGSTNNSVYELIESLLKECEQIPPGGKCRISHLGKKLVSYKNQQELSRLIEIYVTKQNALASTS